MTTLTDEQFSPCQHQEITPMADRACVALLHHQHILLVRQTYRGSTFWTFPGGGIGAGETPVAAAIREVKEETGLDIAIRGSLAQRPRTSGTGMYYCYLGYPIGGQALLGCDPELPLTAQELHELRWFAIATMQTHPEIQAIWAELLAHKELVNETDVACADLGDTEPPEISGSNDNSES
jgi:8-oxo-dGTP diphosphatase